MRRPYAPTPRGQVGTHVPWAPCFTRMPFHDRVQRGTFANRGHLDPAGSGPPTPQSWGGPASFLARWEGRSLARCKVGSLSLWERVGVRASPLPFRPRPLNWRCRAHYPTAGAGSARAAARTPCRVAHPRGEPRLVPCRALCRGLGGRGPHKSASERPPLAGPARGTGSMARARPWREQLGYAPTPTLSQREREPVRRHLVSRSAAEPVSPPTGQPACRPAPPALGGWGGPPASRPARSNRRSCPRGSCAWLRPRSPTQGSDRPRTGTSSRRAGSRSRRPADRRVLPR